ncbi:MAG: galactose ABC transporter substrate-binding protein [Lachnospiraceae bacterium]|jgi:methyl-galactoside transport system substrate-binding protein|nr:galactose ABC transporter substrate-binding protein [Lachnospiraceae bacterium]
MKKKIWLLCAALLAGLAAVWIWIGKGREESGEKEKHAIRLGILLYRGDDTFISNVRQALEEQAKAYEQETGIKVVLNIEDAKENQNTQNSQAERMISLGYDALCVNLVDRSMASVMIDKAMVADVPIVFFNREPVEEDLNLWEKLYYVGVSAKESAVLQGEIVVEAYRKNPLSIDLNGDGKVNYVLLEGETSHQDSLIRTEWSVQTLMDGGVPLEKLTGGIANWERSQASAFMEQWLEEFPGQIELVISNNDDMALGAVDAVQRLQITDPIHIVGIDGTPQGISALERGSLLGTVQCDRTEYAEAIITIAAALALGEEPKEKIGLEDKIYYWVGQKAMFCK